MSEDPGAAQVGLQPGPLCQSTASTRGQAVHATPLEVRGGGSIESIRITGLTWSCGGQGWLPRRFLGESASNPAGGLFVGVARPMVLGTHPTPTRALVSTPTTSFRLSCVVLAQLLSHQVVDTSAWPPAPAGPDWQQLWLRGAEGVSLVPTWLSPQSLRCIA